MPGDNGNENPKEPYTRKYQKHIACSYGYNLVCVDDKCSKPFKTNLAVDEVYSFINSMIEESNYCSKVIKNILTKNLPRLKKTMKILRTLLNVVSVIMIILIMMLKSEIIVISLKNIEVLHIEIVISILN